MIIFGPIISLRGIQKSSQEKYFLIGSSASEEAGLLLCFNIRGITQQSKHNAVF